MCGFLVLIHVRDAFKAIIVALRFEFEEVCLPCRLVLRNHIIKILLTTYRNCLGKIVYCLYWRVRVL